MIGQLRATSCAHKTLASHGTLPTPILASVIALRVGLALSMDYFVKFVRTHNVLVRQNRRPISSIWFSPPEDAEFRWICSPCQRENLKATT